MNMKKGLLHCHSENSRYDSTLNVKDLVSRAKELGYEAVTLTDHGTLTGIDDFVAAAKAEGVKPIPGVEVYVREDDSISKRLHLILLAKDDIGYQGISKIVTDSNKRIESGFPCVNKHLLETYFSDNKKYHDHVIATTACLSGVIGGILTEPYSYKEEIQKLTESLKNLPSIDDASYTKNKEKAELYKKEVAELKLKKDELAKLAKKPFKKKENALAKLAGKPEYEAAEKELSKEKEESLAAAKELEDIKLRIAVTNKRITDLNGKIKEDEKKFPKSNAIREKIRIYESQIVNVEDLEKKAVEELLYYKKLFGSDNFFIELQYHGYESYGMPIEKMVMTTMANLAKRLDIPVCAANDVHIKDNSHNCIQARHILNSIRYGKENPYPIKKGDEELYIKSEDELKDALLKVADSETVDKAIENTYRICDLCTCEFNSGTHYPKFPLPEGKTAPEELKKLAYDGIEARFPGKNGWNQTYQDRLDYELSVISGMGFADYFLIVKDFLEFGRKLGHLKNESLEYLREHIKELSLGELLEYVDSQEKIPGFAIGAGRGSAAGSLVAYLIGITNIVDPLKYDLLFERFLNKERVSMPDVDSDLSPDVRDLVVEYCKKLYGIESVANIVTKGYMKPKGAIRNTARIIGIEKGESAYYLLLADEIAKKIPGKPGTTFADCEESLRQDYEIQSSDDPKTIKRKKDAIEIIEQAKLLENVFLNYGMHAAGVVIADGHPISDYIPLMRDDKSGDMKVQCDMVQVEAEHGLLKFDFLGLRNLKIVTQTIRSVYERSGEVIDVEHLPFDDKVFSEVFSKGLTNSVFQFESGGMKNLLKRFKPTCFEDLIALVSLYRPGPMDFIPQYINSKYHPDEITYLCDELKPILGKTYGCIVYQEQVMEIFQKLGGYSLAQADNVRRFMSKKKHDKLAHEKEDFINGNPERGISGCVSLGISKEVAEELFNQMFAFASYAFNKSHAAAYAMLSYITAYLKYYYASDYMCAILNCNEDMKKMPALINDCKEFGIKVLPPYINKSAVGFSATPGNVLFGLNSIKGTKENSVQLILKERENGEFTDFKDFLKRVPIDKTSMENLIQAGAMDDFHPNRLAMLMLYQQADKPLSIIREKTKLLKELSEMEETPSVLKKIGNAKKALENAELQFQILKLENIPEDFEFRMKKEKEYLGFYVTAHPLDNYRTPADNGCKEISSLSESDRFVTIMGIIENFELKARKSDGKKMAFFDLEDKTGVIQICCFAKAFEKFEFELTEGSVIKLTGKVMVEDNEENSDVEIRISMDKIEALTPDGNEIRVYIDNVFCWNQTVNEMRKKGYLESNHPLVLHDNKEGLFHKTTLYVSEKILNDPAFESEMFI